MCVEHGIGLLEVTLRATGPYAPKVIALVLRWIAMLPNGPPGLVGHWQAMGGGLAGCDWMGCCGL